MNNYVVVQQHKNLAIYNIFGPFDSYQVANDVMKEKNADYADETYLTFGVWKLDSSELPPDTLTFTPDQSLLDRLN